MERQAANVEHPDVTPMVRSVPGVGTLRLNVFGAVGDGMTAGAANVVKLVAVCEVGHHVVPSALLCPAR